MILYKERPNLRKYINNELIKYPNFNLEDVCNGFLLDINNKPIFMGGSLKLQARKMFYELNNKPNRKYTYQQKINNTYE